jgi:large subunit ribosomal protein L11
MIVKLIVDGGSMKPGPAVAQQLGPLGINMGKVISDVNVATADFKGMQVPVELDIDKKTKIVLIKVLSPSVSALIKKELKIEAGTGARKKNKVGNLAIEQVISITKQKQSGMLAKEFVSAVKSVIGSCMSLGCLIENKDPKEILEAIEAGEYKKEIAAQKTEASPEKLKSLSEFFSGVDSAQKADKKKEEEAAAAAEAKKAATAPAAGAAPVAAAVAAKPAAKPAKATK